MIVKYATWYIILVTALTNFLLDAISGLQHGVLLHVLLSFTLTFHLWSINSDRWQLWHAKFKKFMLFYYFSIFAFMSIHSQTTKLYL